MSIKAANIQIEYLEIDGEIDELISAEAITVYSSIKDVISFQCPNELINRFAEYRRKQIGRPSIIAGTTGIGLKDSFSIVKTGQGYGEWAEPNEIER